MHPRSVDVENELREIGVGAGHLPARLTRLDMNDSPHDTQKRWEAIAVCASAAEKIYTGCERVMSRPASEHDQLPVIHAEGWHTALLWRMANPLPDRRGPVISHELHGLMNRLRAFRHHERNTYGSGVEHGIVVVRATEAVAGYDRFSDEVRLFLLHDSTAAFRGVD